MPRKTSILSKITVFHGKSLLQYPAGVILALDEVSSDAYQFNSENFIRLRVEKAF